MSTYRWANFKR